MHKSYGEFMWVSAFFYTLSDSCNREGMRIAAHINPTKSKKEKER